jgi:hypothetical protein
MTSHQAGAVPQWETIPPEEWNQYQIRAAETHGIDTPGNRETLKGLVANVGAMALIEKGYPELALPVLVYAQLKDFTDGKRAHETGTKGPLGELADSGADKAFAGLAGYMSHRKGILRPADNRDMLIQNGANVVFSGAAKIGGQEIHPNPAGKALRWIQAFAFGAGVTKLAARKYNAPKLEAFADTTSHVLSVVGTRVVGGVATLGYAVDASGLRDPSVRERLKTTRLGLWAQRTKEKVVDPYSINYHNSIEA